jgi:hypothetical protein
LEDKTFHPFEGTRRARPMADSRRATTPPLPLLAAEARGIWSVWFSLPLCLSGVCVRALLWTRGLDRVRAGVRGWERQEERGAEPNAHSIARSSRRAQRQDPLEGRVMFTAR